jgi:hypothetical protein
MSLYLAPSLIPSILTSFPVPAEEKHPHSMMLPPPCFTGGGILGVMRGVGFVTDSVFLDGKKLNFDQVSSDQSTFFHMFGEFPTCPLANTKRLLIFFL